MKIKKRVLSSLLCACLISPAIFSNVNAQENQCPDFSTMNPDATFNLKGDILVNQDTEHDKLYLAKKKEILKFKGTLDVTPIKNKLEEVKEMVLPNSKAITELKNQLKSKEENLSKLKEQLKNTDKKSENYKKLEEQVTSLNAEIEEIKTQLKAVDEFMQNINVSCLTFSMTAKFTLPEGVKFKDEKPTAKLEGNSKFEVKSTTLNGKTVTVVMQLKDQDIKGTYDKFTKMDDAVKNCEDTLVLSLSDAEFEDSVKNGKHNGESLVANGDVVGNFSAKATIISGNSANFKFVMKSEQSDSGKDFALKNDTNNKNIQLTLTIPYDVKYEFESTTNGKDLPQDVKDKLPKPYEVEKGKTATVDEKGTEKVTFDNVELADGRWIFNNWDKTKVENVSSDVIFKGFWKFEKVYKVNYEFKSNTSDKELPQEVKKLLPQEEKYYSIQKVKPKDVTPKEVKVGNDTWTFKGFDKNEITLKDGENKFIGSWECKTKQVPTPTPFEKVYKVSYEFKSNTSDKELPQEVKKLLPQEEKYYSIQKVKPKDVTPKEVKVGNDTWTFKGFDKNEITLKDGENKFIGSWECKTKQVPTPDPVPTPNPTLNPGLDEDEDENNNNDKKQNDKEQKLPQTNIAGNSLLTLALSAIAVVFSKKKRK